MGEHDTELVIQLVKQQTELWIRDRAIHSGRVPTAYRERQAL
jgi:hypothetical protein